MPHGIQLCLAALLALRDPAEGGIAGKTVTLKVEVSFLFCLAEELDPSSLLAQGLPRLT